MTINNLGYSGSYNYNVGFGKAKSVSPDKIAKQELKQLEKNGKTNNRRQELGSYRAAAATATMQMQKALEKNDIEAYNMWKDYADDLHKKISDIVDQDNERSRNGSNQYDQVSKTTQGNVTAALNAAGNIARLVDTVAPVVTSAIGVE